MSVRVERLVYFLLVTACFFVGLIIFDKISFILIPFLIALIFATLLNPITSLMSRKIPRALAAGISSIFVILTLSFLLLSILPFLYRETMNLISLVTEKSIGDGIILKINEVARYLDANISISQKSIFGYIKDDAGILKTIATNIFQGAQSLTTLIFVIVVYPFMMFMILKDMPYLSNAIINSIKPSYRKTVSSTIKDINNLIFSYFGGQFIVSIFLFTFYMIFFSVFHVHNKLYISLIVAISNFFPYIGFYISTIIALFLNVKGVEHVTLYNVTVMLSILGIGQLIEGNLVTPKIVGDRVGLRPIFIILGTMISIPIFGVMGLVLGTPMTIIVSYLFRRFAIQHSSKNK